MHRARIRAAVAVLASVVAFGVPGPQTATAAPAARSFSYTHGYDVSWPQCNGRSARSMPAGRPAYVILGLTHGTGHTVNPCLRSQLRWAGMHGALVGGYLVASYPTHRQRAQSGRGLYGRCHRRLLCRLRNDGAGQVHDALSTMRRMHMRSPMVWLDVEFRHQQPWTRNHRRNRAVLEGMVRALHHNHRRFGVYTTGYMWRVIAGRYRLDVPQWLPSGRAGASRTKPMCRQTATGGITWLVQYTARLDQDLTCPVLGALNSHLRGAGSRSLLTRIVARV
ncbi:MAG TPA: hypothetical protein VG899_01775 [Mycobacteriales bacterium]|nr:hypothetical protein [Mycobacteriales bacterium]